MSIIICGPDKSETPGYGRCICCHRDLPLEQIAVSVCWDCQTGNFDCDRCNAVGVPLDRFSMKRGKEHRFKEWWVAKFDDPEIGEVKTAITCCGLLIPYEDLGQGIFDRKWCKRCWPARGWPKGGL